MTTAHCGQSASPLRPIPFDALQLAAVLAELRQAITGAQVQEVRQPDPVTVQLKLHKDGIVRLLLISLDARWARIHFTTARLANAQTPYSFCSAARRHLEGKTVASIEQIGFDRFVCITFVGHHTPDTDEEAAPPRRLYLELMGRHSNAVLTDDTLRIIECARKVTHRINRIRQTLPGLKYTFPPNINSEPLPSPSAFAAEVLKAISPTASLSASLISEAVRKAEPRVSPFLANELALQAIASSEATVHDARVWCADSMPISQAIANVYRIAISRSIGPIETDQVDGAGAYPLPTLQLPPEVQRPATTLNAGLDRGYARTFKLAAAAQALSRISGDLKSELEHLERTAESMLTTAAEGTRAEEYSRRADLIYAFINQIPDGAEFADLPDLYDPEQKPIRITLDKELSPVQNATLYNNKASLARSRQKRAEERLDTLLPRLDELRAIAYSTLERLSQSNVRADEIEQARKDLIKQGWLRNQPTGVKQQGDPLAGHKIRRLHSPQGFEVLLGESSTANDYLTTRVAAPSDIWMHVRAATGSHVVIRSLNKPELVPFPTILWAAGICAKHSDQKHSSLVAVDYTQKRYVRKPRGSNPGFAVYTHEKTLHVAPEEA
jgi:predicted ribosome quality control (RQC) complex YloA/Tae2 family protein